MQVFRRNIKVTDQWEDMRRWENTSKTSLGVDYSQLIHEDPVNYDSCYFNGDRSPGNMKSEHIRY
jgi:hypothetical protein